MEGQKTLIVQDIPQIHHLPAKGLEMSLGDVNS